MSQQRLPLVPNLKSTPSNFDIAIIMNNHKKKIQQLRGKRSSSKNHTLTYRDLLEQNPKKTYFLQTKYTEIERENRLLFEKISGLSKSKKKHSSFSQNHIGSLNATHRKQQIQDIQRENVKMFGRIQMQKPSISFRQTDRDYFKNKKLMERLSNINKNKLHDWYA